MRTAKGDMVLGKACSEPIHDQREFASWYVKPARIAAHGNVMSQERTIALITRGFALPVVRPIPKSEPTETCVVETGRPYKVASTTRIAVVKFAAKPWPRFIVVILLLIVSATLFALSKPPIAIVIATATNPQRMSSAFHKRSSATIFGVSFKPRAKLTVPALRKWAASMSCCELSPRNDPA